MTRPDPQTYLGGHDAGVCLGLQPFGKTRLDVWEEKTGRKPSSVPSSWRMDKGLYLEPLLCQWYEQQRGVKVQNRDEFITHADDKIIAGHPDGIAHIDGKYRLVEFKLTQRREHWTEPPDDYVSQCQHYGAILRSIFGDTFAMAADLVVDHGAAEPSIFTVELTPEKLDYLESCERQLWYEHVNKDIPPEPETLAECLARWPQNTDAVVEATPEVVLALEQLAKVKSRLDAEKAKKDNLELLIKRFMEDAGTLLWQGRKIVTWTSSKPRRSVDVASLKEAGLYDAFCKEGNPIRTFRPKDLTDDMVKAAHAQTGARA